MFGVICWYLWRARNDRIFSGKEVTAAEVAACSTCWQAAITADLNRNSKMLESRPEREKADVVWDPGPAGWMTLDSDASADRRRGKATIGGLLQDCNGRCIFAYSMNLGACSITRTEMRGAIKGLTRAWEAGYRRIIVQIDSRAAIALLKGEGDQTHQHGMESAQFQELLRRDWQVLLKHIYREGNHAADYLA
ncbi:Putative ribonuclease H protein At1g65750 [Linum perenne]